MKHSSDQIWWILYLGFDYIKLYLAYCNYRAIIVYKYIYRYFSLTVAADPQLGSHGNIIAYTLYGDYVWKRRDLFNAAWQMFSITVIADRPPHAIIHCGWWMSIRERSLIASSSNVLLIWWSEGQISQKWYWCRKSSEYNRLSIERWHIITGYRLWYECKGGHTSQRGTQNES